MEEDKELELVDWKGNFIEEGDTVKLICFKKLKNVEKAKHQPGDIHYILPDNIDLWDSVEPQVLKTGDEEVDWCFQTLIEKEVIPFGDKKVIHLNGMMYMTVQALVNLTESYMDNCMVAIEGKSDDKEEFFLKYFEL